MRVYFVSPSLTGRGGVESVLLRLDPLWDDLGQEVVYLCMGPGTADPEWDAPLRPRVRYFAGPYAPPPRTRHGVVEITLALGRVLGRLPRPDALVALSPWMVGVTRMAAAVYGAPPPLVVGWYHVTLGIFPEGERELVRHADAHLAISSGVRDEVARLHPGAPQALVYNPVAAAGRLVPRPRDRATFLYMGRLDVRQKRLDRLLRAASRLDRDRFRLRIFGAPALEEQGQEASLRRLAEELGVAPAVEWMGWRSDPWAEVDEATALVLTSDWEGFSVVLAEALAHGVPVIASDCPVGPRDIVVPGENGYLFPPQDEGELARLMAGAAEGTLPLPAGEACVRSVERFRPEAVARRIADALEAWTLLL
ncbi:MAG: glycosyltransferase [Firmicutes bacterium]|nr:glycosyltransferase [Bacillota bacterium]